jgi:hypothetical protein
MSLLKSPLTLICGLELPSRDNRQIILVDFNWRVKTNNYILACGHGRRDGADTVSVSEGEPHVDELGGNTYQACEDYRSDHTRHSHSDSSVILRRYQDPRFPCFPPPHLAEYPSCVFSGSLVEQILSFGVMLMA